MIFGERPDSVEFDLYESFAKTYRGHGTDIALVGGILGMEPDDPRLSDSLKIAHEQGMEVLFVPKKEIADHPNTVTLRMIKGDLEMSVTGVSIGGGNIQITEMNGYSISLGMGNPTYIIINKDVPGLLSRVSTIFMKHGLNIGKVTMTRKTRGENGIVLLEIDDTPDDPEGLRQEIKREDDVLSVTYFK
jgi:L-serine dehydratase